MPFKAVLQFDLQNGTASRRSAFSSACAINSGIAHLPGVARGWFRFIQIRIGVGARASAAGAVPSRQRRYDLAAALFVPLFLGGFTEPAMSCADRLTEYIGKLEALFAQELESTTPFRTLNKAYFPLKSCDVDEISRAVSQSRYLGTIEKKPNSITVFVLSHGIIEVGFGYSTKKQSSDLDYVRIKK